jgi:hypothetical protein
MNGWNGAMKKRCSKCKKTKPVNEFYYSSGFYSSSCIECQANLEDKPVENFSQIIMRDENNLQVGNASFNLCVETCKSLESPFDYIVAVLHNDEWFEISRSNDEELAKEIHWHVKKEMRKKKDDICNGFIKQVKREVENIFLKNDLTNDLKRL